MTLPTFVYMYKLL